MPRRATPLSLKILRGNPSKQGLGTVAARMPRSSGASTDPPADLEGAALDKWNATVSMLVGMRVWSADCAGTWARYCRTWALWRSAIAVVERDGQVYEAPSGLPKMRPETVLARCYAADLLRIESCFGLVPSAKAAVGPALESAGPAGDPLAAFLAE